MTNLEEAKAKLEQLIQSRDDLERELENELHDPDPDPSRIIALKKQMDESSVHAYAIRARIIRLERTASALDREQALSLKDELKNEYAAAAKEYAAAIAVAEDKWLAYQSIGVKLFSLDSRIENDRDALNERQRELAQHLSRWKQDAYSHLTTENVCDY